MDSKEGKQAAAKRETNYDLLRIAATFCVILIHVNWHYFGAVYENPSATAVWILQSLINIVTRFSVPAFVMLSGAFILQDERNAKAAHFYKKSFFKIILPTLAVIIILAAFLVASNVLAHRGIVSGLAGILTGNFFNLWYVYMLVFLYLLVPLIMLVKRHVGWGRYKVAAIAVLVWAVVSQATSHQSLPYSIGVVGAFLGYFLIGDVLKQTYSDKECNVLVAGLLCVLCVVASFVYRYAGNNFYTSYAYTTFFSPATVIFSLCVFALTSRIEVGKDLSRLSSITFEVYLFHTLVLNIGSAILDGFGLPVLVSELLLCIFTCVFSALFAVAFKALWKPVSNAITPFFSNLGIWQDLEA